MPNKAAAGQPSVAQSPPLLDDAPTQPSPGSTAGSAAGSAHDVTQLGITLKGLRKLIDKVKQLCEEGGIFQTDFDHLTTTELVYR